MSPTSYDSIAQWYDEVVRPVPVTNDLALSHLLAMLASSKGQSVCDLACGQGRLARALAQRGWQITGVDLSSELIGIAQRDEDADPAGVTYLVDNAESLSLLDDHQFDGVVCNLALMDIPDLAAAYKSVWRILRPGGWFIFSITHPCFESPHAVWHAAPDGAMSREIVSYFVEGFWRSTNPHGIRGRVGAHHRTLSTYLNTLIQTLFVIDHVIEPQAFDTNDSSVPDDRVIPASMLVRCTKLAAS